MNKIYYTIFSIMLFSCIANPYKISEKSYKKQLKVLKSTLSKKDFFELEDGRKSEWISTINFNMRKPNFIIIHHTAQDSLQQTIKTFTLEKTQVSSHYVIGDNGKVIQMLSDYLRAWHAGNATWGKITDMNSTSIGIELDNNGSELFSDAQIDSLIKLLSRLKKLYNIPTQNIIGHLDIAPSRKNDPSELFPWRKLAENGFGIWPDEILKEAPIGFDVDQGLRIIGYSTKNLPDAIKSFKRHYMQTEINDVLDTKTINTIYSVFLKI
jgi:N-acetylmuramoyl-L-alanine amidase